jgi:sucrose-6-phosphate hydrolase SacC (GH32 family)
MTVPVELRLRRTDDGLRMFAELSEGLLKLKASEAEKLKVELTKGPKTLIDDLDAALISMEITPTRNGSMNLRVRGLNIDYEPGKGLLTCGKLTVPLKPKKNEVLLDILIDRGSVEVFGNDGIVAVSMAYIAPENDKKLTASGNGMTLERVILRPMKSAWK